MKQGFLSTVWSGKATDIQILYIRKLRHQKSKEFAEDVPANGRPDSGSYPPLSLDTFKWWNEGAEEGVPVQGEGKSKFKISRAHYQFTHSPEKILCMWQFSKNKQQQKNIFQKKNTVVKVQR